MTYNVFGGTLNPTLLLRFEDKDVGLKDNDLKSETRTRTFLEDNNTWLQ